MTKKDINIRCQDISVFIKLSEMYNTKKSTAGYSYSKKEEIKNESN